MAKKEKKAAPAAKKETMTPEEKAAKKKARLEAIRNRPAEQRPNSKQVDVIDLGDGNVIKSFGYPIKKKNEHVGILVTAVSLKNGEVTSVSTSFVEGDLTVKAKKGHGTICAPKHKGDAPDTDSEEDDNDSDESDED